MFLCNNAAMRMGLDVADEERTGRLSHILSEPLAGRMGHTAEAQAMSKYSIEAPLRSCFLSKDTVERLEKYMFEKAAAINQLSPDEVKEDFQIESIDSLGTETFRSIHEHARYHFASDTRRLVLTYRRYHDKLTALKIGFGVNEQWSTLEVTVDGPNARETATAIVHEVQALLKDHATLNFIFHGRYVVLPFIAFGISIGVSLVLLDSKISPELKAMYAAIALTVVGFWLLFATLRKINPYVLFDTPRNAKIQQSFGFVLKALFGVVVVGGLTKFLLT